METDIFELEKIARQLEPGETDRKKQIQSVYSYVDNFLAHLPEMPAYREGSPQKLMGLDIPDNGRELSTLLDLLKMEMDRIGINAASGKHLGYIPGGGIWTSALGDFIAASTNRYAGVAYASPPAVAIENKLIAWLCELVGYPATAHGNLSSGGSISNLIAIQAARDAKNIRAANMHKCCVYFTGQVHHCVHKAFHTTGLYEAQLRSIPMNEKYQMDTAALEVQMESDVSDGLIPTLVIATAGTTDTGAVDPLNEIADICEKYDAWFHVDAAYGGFFMLLPEMHTGFKGIQRSDSVVMDPHKTLFLPYGSGVVLVRNRNSLFESNARKAAYMKDTYGMEDVSPADTGPELSKHFRGLRMWLPLQLHGIEPFRANLREKLWLCTYFREKIGTLGFQTGPEPDLSVTIFRFSDDPENNLTQRLMDELHGKGTYFFSSTIIDGKMWIRCAIASFRTHKNEIDEALEMIRLCSEALVRKDFN